MSFNFVRSGTAQCACLYLQILHYFTTASIWYFSNYDWNPLQSPQALQRSPHLGSPPPRLLHACNLYIAMQINPWDTHKQSGLWQECTHLHDNISKIVIAVGGSCIQLMTRLVAISVSHPSIIFWAKVTQQASSNSKNLNPSLPDPVQDSNHYTGSK